MRRRERRGRKRAVASFFWLSYEEVGLGVETNVPARVVGRYALYGSIASGGMATVHLGRLMGPVGFSRTVAIKRLHAQFAQDPEFVSMFLDEARLAARIRHPNVVPTLDVVATSGELFLVMEYVPGDSLSRLYRATRERREKIPQRVVSAIMSSVLHGLHAAHEAKSERGAPLGIVHRDVSPQNVLVGTDGVARVLDFGVAKAAGRTQETRDGQIKGKLSYMPPEQLRGGEVSRQCDIYAAGVVLWELLTGERLFTADNEGALLAKVLGGVTMPPSRFLMPNDGTTLNGDTYTLYKQLDELTLRALSAEPAQRFETARDMAVALERCIPPATPFEVGEWVESIAADVLGQRATLVAEIESSASMNLSKELGTLGGGASGIQEIERTRVDRPPIPASSSGAPMPGDSQLSSISVAGPPHTRPPAPPRTLAAVLGAVAATLLVVVLVAGAIVLKKSRGATPPVAATPTSETAPTAVLPLAPPPNLPSDTSTVPSAIAPIDPSVPVVASATPSATATGRTRPPVRPPPKPPSSAATPTPVAPTPAPATPTDCVYWEKGIKHVNPKCL